MVYPANPAASYQPRQSLPNRAIAPTPPTAPRANTADPACFSVYVYIRMNARLYGFFYVCIYACMQNLVNI